MPISTNDLCHRVLRNTHTEDHRIMPTATLQSRPTRGPRLPPVSSHTQRSSGCLTCRKNHSKARSSFTNPLLTEASAPWYSSVAAFSFHSSKKSPQSRYKSMPEGRRQQPPTTPRRSSNEHWLRREHTVSTVTALWYGHGMDEINKIPGDIIISLLRLLDTTQVD